MRVICQDVVSTEYSKTVVCEDGYQLHYRVWPASGASTGTMILVNGMMSHSIWFRELANGLTGRQVDVIGADRRGSGPNEPDRGDAPSRRMLISDLCKIIENEHRGAPIYVVGWCWGALPTVNLALELGAKLSGVVLLAPGLFPSQLVKRRAQAELLAAENAKSDSAVLRSPLTEEMFSNRIDVQDFIRNDDLSQRMFTPRFFRITGEMSLIATARLSQLPQPLLLLLATNDATIDHDQTVKAFHRLPSTALTIGTIPCNHGMQFEAPREVVNHISRWLQQDHGFAAPPS